jgi:hypothetical protein
LSCAYSWDICKLEKNWRGAWCTEFDVNFQILWLLQLCINYDEMYVLIAIVGPSVNPSQCIAMYVSTFLNSQVWKEIMLELNNGKPSKCYHVLNWFFVPNPGFLEFFWIFSSSRNHLKINISHILNPNLTK